MYDLGRLLAQATSGVKRLNALHAQRETIDQQITKAATQLSLVFQPSNGAGRRGGTKATSRKRSKYKCPESDCGRTFAAPQGLSMHGYRTGHETPYTRKAQGMRSRKRTKARKRAGKKVA